METQKVKVSFTYALARFYPDLKPMEIEASSISEILNIVDQRHGGFSDYIQDEHGRLRKHVNIFFDNTLIQDREGLTDSLEGVTEVYIMQALSGG